jgi:peptidoglycan/xylan/chitin deacetylase (PgdA/CDA1 family)
MARLRLIVLLAAATFVGSISVSFAYADEGVIAVTFDDLPIAAAGSKSEATRRKMTLRLMHALTEREIPATGFVNESGLLVDGEVSEERVDLLRLWLASGMDLGNHSYSHPDLHSVSVDEFTTDVLRGDVVTRQLLAERGRVPEYFRHPYLHTGRSLEIREQVEAILVQHQYKVAPVTIDNSEWIFARAFDLAMLDENVDLADRVGRDYVDYMMQVMAYYGEQSRMLFDRNIPQVLLLHANLLNSLWFGTLADDMASSGYRFSTLQTVLQDPAYQSADTFTGAGGITWLHRWAITRQIDPDKFRGEPQTPDYILRLTEQREHSYVTEP